MNVRNVIFRNYNGLSWVAMRFLNLVPAAFLALCCLHVSAAEKFVFGVFDKYDVAEAGSQEWRDHYERLADLLAHNHINGVVLAANKNPVHTLELLDLMRRSNIGVLQTIGNPLSRKWDMAGPQHPFHSVYTHDGILAYKFGDEPKALHRVTKIARRYDAISRHYVKPIVTALIGELMEDEDEFSSRVWNMLGSEIKFVRFYGLRRQYELYDWYAEKTKLDFVAWCRYMEKAHGSTPWWFIVQAFGRAKQKSHGSYWRLPTAAEMNAQLHTALAHGARGIWGFALQPFGNPKNVFMLDRDFQPVRAHDESNVFEAFTQVAHLVEKYEQFFLNHIPGPNVIEVVGGNVVALERRLEGSENSFMYLVNLQGEQKVSVKLPSEFADGSQFVDMLNQQVFYPDEKTGGRWLEVPMLGGQARVLTVRELSREL